MTETMQTEIEFLRIVALALYVGLSVVSLRLFFRHRNVTAAWAASAFGSLAVVVVVGRLMPDEGAPRLAVIALVIALIAYPYLLFRFSASLDAATRRTELILGSVTGAMVVWTLFIPSFEVEGRPLWLLAYSIAFVVQWTVLFVVVSRRMWIAGASEPIVARKSMRLMAAGTAGMNVAVFVSVLTTDGEPAILVLVSQLISISAALGFLLGLSPPRMVRAEWRRPQQGALQQAVAGLMIAETREQVANTALPHVARIVGARACALVDNDGDVVLALGTDAATVHAALAGTDDPTVVCSKIASGYLIAWTSRNAMFFASEDIESLHALGGILDLALHRCSQLSEERRFIANAAHELRTPLTTLSGLSVTLAERRDMMDPTEMDECFAALGRQGERTRILIKNLLDLAELEHGSPILDPRAVQLVGVAQRARESAPPPPGKKVTLDIPRNVMAYADEARIEQVIVNLLTNAYRYGGDAITIHAYADNDDVLLVVLDDGAGVARELVPQLFQPFGRGSVGDGAGSGLGLAIVRRLVAAFGGDIWYEPGQPRGAKFTVKLKSAA